MSFLSDYEMEECRAMMDEPFKTFAEVIAVYKTPTETYVGEGNNFNFMFGAQPDAQMQYDSKLQYFSGVIEFLDDRDNQQLGYFNPNQPVLLNKGYIRLGLSGMEARNFMKGVEKVVFDSGNYKLISDTLHRGILNRNYQDYYLEKLD